MIITLPTLFCRFQGLALFGKIILIKKGHEHLIPHEKIHLKQQQESGFLGLWYHWDWLFDKQFRAQMEVQAYRIADKLNNDEIEEKLRTLYGIEIDPREWTIWR